MLINIKKENSLKKKFLIFFVIIILFFYDLVGAISLLIVTFLTFLLVKVYPKLEFMLITALFLRILQFIQVTLFLFQTAQMTPLSLKIWPLIGFKMVFSLLMIIQYIHLSLLVG